MALEKQLAEIVFSQGADKKTDAKMMINGSLETLENGVFRKGLTISKRYGTTQLSDTGYGTTPSNVAGSLASYQGGLVRFLGRNVQERVGDYWASRGKATNLALTLRDAVRDINEQRRMDAAAHAGYVMAAWNDSKDSGVDPASLLVAVYKQATGELVHGPVDVAPLTADKRNVRCAVLSTNIIAYWPGGSGAQIHATSFNTNVPTTAPSATEVIAATDLAATQPYFDVASDPAKSQYAFLVYVDATNTTGGNQEIKIKRLIGPATSDISREIATGLADLQGVTCAVLTGGKLAIYAARTTATAGHVAYILNEDLTDAVSVGALGSAHTDTAAMALVEHEAAGEVFVLLQKGSGASNKGDVRFLAINISSGAVTSGSLHAGKLCGAMYLDADLHIVLLMNYENQESFMIYRKGSGSSGGELVGKALYGEAYWPAGDEGPAAIALPPRAILDTANRKQILVRRKGAVGTDRIGLSLMEIEAGRTDINPAREFGQAMVVASAEVMAMDGRSMVEAGGFHLFPEVSLKSAAETGTLGTGSFQVVATYEYLDNNGELHRSAPAKAFTQKFTSGSTNGFSVYVTENRWTHKAPKTVLWVTEADRSIFYRYAEKDHTKGESEGFLVTSAPDITSEVLYTQSTDGATGGEIENIAPTSARYIATWDNRVFLAGMAENRRLIWYSKPRRPGIAVEFSDVQTISLPATAGEVTGLSGMDDKLIIFTDDAIYAMAGEGPDAFGNNNGYTTPRRVASDVGCIGHRSIVLTPQGLMFLSRKGIYLLDRGLGTSYIGARVEGLESGITSAVVVPQQHQVRFTRSSGSCLVFDYLFNQWSVFTGWDASHAIGVGDSYYFMLSSGSVRQESSAVYTDNGSQYTFKVSTGWIKFPLAQGFMRLWRMLMLGDKPASGAGSNYSIQATLALDYDTDVVETHTLANVHSLVTAGDPIQFRSHLQRQKCEAVKVTIEDTGANRGASFNLSALTFEVGIKKGAMKLQADRTVV